VLRAVAVALIVLASACGVSASGPACPEGQHVESRTSIEYSYHYGYNVFSGKWEFHLGPETKTDRWCSPDTTP
jgi:hypothetical protein